MTELKWKPYGLKGVEVLDRMDGLYASVERLWPFWFVYVSKDGWYERRHCFTFRGAMLHVRKAADAMTDSTPLSERANLMEEHR